MSKDNNQNAPLSLESQIDEDRVRRALGLTPSGTHQQRPEQARQRHRFVADGAVPVVMLNRTDSEVSGLRERLAAAEHALEGERSAHAATRRALHDVQAAFQALQTRFGHTELGHGEMLQTEREARQAAEAALSALKERVAAPVERAPVERKKRVKRETGPGREAGPGREPKPVRWWTPTYRAKP